MNNETMIDLILENDALEIQEFIDLFRELFDNQLNKKYYEDLDLSKEYRDAIECLFDVELSINDRINDALNICRYCFEAFYFFKMLADERELYNYLDLLLYSAKDNNPYKNLSEYENTAVTLVFEDTASLYMFRDNFKKAITAIYTEAEIDASTYLINKIKLFICYEKIEDVFSFKKLYENGYVDDLVSYLLYICVLIKSLQSEEIADVLMDMFHDFDEAYDYIKAKFLEEDYDVDEEVELAFEFAKSSIESIPNFYDILIDVIRKNNISPNNLEN